MDRREKAEAEGGDRFYGGKKTSETPSIQLCLIQASLNYGVMAMYAFPPVQFAWLTKPSGHQSLHAAS